MVQARFGGDEKGLVFPIWLSGQTGQLTRRLGQIGWPGWLARLSESWWRGGCGGGLSEQVAVGGGRGCWQGGNGGKLTVTVATLAIGGKERARLQVQCNGQLIKNNGLSLAGRWPRWPRLNTCWNVIGMNSLGSARGVSGCLLWYRIGGAIFCSSLRLFYRGGRRERGEMLGIRSLGTSN